MKNFKKVISAVIALAMVISSFTAVSASKFADVADTAKYAEAVEVLTALGIVEGTEVDGAVVFQPEKEVTRTEAVAMLVRAINMKDDAEASKGTSQFADVNTQAAWAQGYVNVGVAQGFINGYDASTFGPLDNVTYSQLCKMLTCMAGYGEYAVAKGGWPHGYTSIAGEIGLSKGIAASTDAVLTKGQVAQMIYNALQTPKLGVYLYAAVGNSYTQLDGKDDRDFETLLSEKFGGYVATVTIDGTPVSNTELENDEVEFTVTKCDWWPETEEPCTTNDTYATNSLFAAGVDVNGNALQTGKAVFVTNDDDELVMVYFKSTGKTETKELAADSYVPQSRLSASNQYAADNLKFKFGSSYYKVDSSVDVYVNGSLFTTLAIREATESSPAVTAADVRRTADTLIHGAQGTVKLVKEGDANYYTAIFVDYYQIAKVSAVDVEDDEITVTLTGSKAVISEEFDEIVISTEAVEEGNTIVTVTKNGEEASLEDLKKGDIIAYAVDFANEDDLEDPKVINVIATDDTASGVVTKVNAEDNKYTIGGTVYSKIGSVSDLELKNSLILTLDPFGRIYAAEADGSSTKYAIVLRVSANEDEVTLLLADGSSKTYEPTSAVDLGEVADEIAAAGSDVTARIVEYKVKNSTGEISSINFVEGELVDDEYKSRTNKVGSFTISSTTAVIDATKVEDATDARKAGSYAVYSTDSFTDGTSYDGVAFKDGTFVSFVVLTNVGTTFGESARFAVVRDEAVQHFTEDTDDECELVLALYEGDDEAELLFVPDLYDEAGLDIGDAFFFETDADGFVSEVYKVYDAGTKALSTLIEAGATADMLPEGTDGWSYQIWDEGNAIQLAKAIVTDIDDKSITFAKWDDDMTYLDTNVDLDRGDHEDGVVTYGFADDAVAYIYDADSDEYEEARKFKKKDVTSIKASNFDRFDIFEYEVEGEEGEEPEIVEDDDNNGIFAGEDMFDYANEALVMLVDGDVVAIYVIEK